MNVSRFKWRCRTKMRVASFMWGSILPFVSFRCLKFLTVSCCPVVRWKRVHLGASSGGTVLTVSKRKKEKKDPSSAVAPSDRRISAETAALYGTFSRKSQIANADDPSVAKLSLLGGHDHLIDLRATTSKCGTNGPFTAT